MTKINSLDKNVAVSNALKSKFKKIVVTDKNTGQIHQFDTKEEYNAFYEARKTNQPQPQPQPQPQKFR